MSVEYKIRESIVKRIVDAMVLAADLTDHLEPRIGEVNTFDPETNREFRTRGWKEVVIGPLSGSLVAREEAITEEIKRIRRFQEGRPAYMMRQRVSNLLKGVGIYNMAKIIMGKSESKEKN